MPLKPLVKLPPACMIYFLWHSATPFLFAIFFFFFLVTNRLTCVAFLSEFSLCPEVTKNNITVLDLKSEREMREGQKGGEKEGKEQRNGKTAQTIQLHFRKQHKWTWNVYTHLYIKSELGFLEPESQCLRKTVRNLLLGGEAGLKAWSREKRLKYIRGITQNFSKSTVMITPWEMVSQEPQNPAVEPGMKPRAAILSPEQDRALGSSRLSKNSSCQSLLRSNLWNTVCFRPPWNMKNISHP